MTYIPFAAALDWEATPMPPLPEPPDHFDNLDGLNREELVAAQIAKYRDLLQPDMPAT